MTNWFVEVPEVVAAEAQAFNARLELALAAAPSVHTVDPRLVRLARREGKGLFGQLTYVPQAREVDAGGVKLRVFAPDGAPRGIYFHIHGGGWTLGGCDQQDVQLAALANATGLVAASVEYRLAPEHPWPAAADDCETAARWLLAHAGELGAPAELAIGGESAGAHLAVVTLLRVPSAAWRAANLAYGAYDLSGVPSVRRWGNRNLVLSKPIVDYFADNLLGARTSEERRAPDISPLYADLHGMPPALFTVGALDPLIDDTLFMAARWRLAGSPTTLRIWPHAVHGFNGFPIELGRMADRDQHAFLARFY